MKKKKSRSSTAVREGRRKKCSSSSVKTMVPRQLFAAMMVVLMVVVFAACRANCAEGRDQTLFRRLQRRVVAKKLMNEDDDNDNNNDFIKINEEDNVWRADDANQHGRGARVASGADGRRRTVDEDSVWGSLPWLPNHRQLKEHHQQRQQRQQQNNNNNNNNNDGNYNYNRFVARRAMLQSEELTDAPPPIPPPAPPPAQCQPGTFFNETDLECMECEPGFYTNAEGLTACLPCPDYHFCANYSTSDPVPCEPGTSSLAGAATCYTCESGIACPGDGNAPTPCPAGTAAPEKSSKCDTCPAREYARAKAAECSDCPSGYACAKPGTKWPPRECKAGFYAQERSITCHECPQRTYSPKKQSASCTTCPAGTRCPFNATSTPDLCPLGTYSLEGAITCNVCPLGSICQVTDAEPTPCFPGTYRSSPLLYYACSACPPGYSCETNYQDPVPCLNGTFALARSTECTVCPVGYECPSVFSDLQIRCEDGTFSVGNQKACAICPAGFACPYYDQNVSIPCDDGTYSGPGQAHCTPCTPGYKCPDKGDPETVAACPKGTWSGKLATECTECQKGYYSTAIGAIGPDTCKPCPPGTFSRNTGRTERAACKRCPRGTFCPEEATVEPTTCPENLISSEDRSVCVLPPPPPSPPPLPPSPPSPPPPPPPRPTNAVPPHYVAKINFASGANANVNDFNDAAQLSFREAIAELLGMSVDGVTLHPPFRQGSVVVEFSVVLPGDIDGMTATGLLEDAERRGVLNVGPLFVLLTLSVECQPGSYIDTEKLGYESCQPCPAGTAINVSNAPFCELCDIGSAAPSLGQIECDICPPGWVTPRRGVPDCRACNEGFFSPFPGSDMCSPCEGNFVSNGTGTPECIECELGWEAVDNNTACEPIVGFMLEVEDFKGVMSATVIAMIIICAILTSLLFMQLYRKYRFAFKYLNGDHFFEAMTVEQKTEEDLMGMDPRTERADFFALGRYMSEGRLFHAKKIIERILHRNPLHPDALHLMAIVHYRYAEYDDALGFVTMALKQAQRPQFFNTMGLIMEARGESTRASEQFEVATRRDPMFAVSFFNLGNLRAEEGIADEALEFYEKAFERDSLYYKVSFNTGTLLLNIGRFTEAKRAFKSALKAAPRSEEAQFNLLCTLIRQRKLDEAQELAQLLVANNESFAPAYAKLGNIFLMQGLFKKAGEKYIMALEHNRHLQEAQSGMGVCEFQQGNYREAETFLKMAIDKGDFFQAHYNLAVLYLTTSQHELCLASYHAAREAGPKHRDELKLLANDLRLAGILREKDEAVTEEEEAAAKARRAHEAEQEAQQRLRERTVAEAKEEGDTTVSASSDFFAMRSQRKRPWRRLLLLSNRTKAPEILADAARSDVGVVSYDHYRTSLSELAILAQQKLQGFKAESIAIVAPSKPGAVGTVKGWRTNMRSLKRAETIDFWTEIAMLLQPPSSFDMSNASAHRAIHLLTTDVAGSPEAQHLIASLESLVQLPVFASDDILNARRLAIDTEGARVSRLYFASTKLLQWTVLPDLSMMKEANRGIARAMNENSFKSLVGFKSQLLDIRAQEKAQLKAIGGAYGGPGSMLAGETPMTALGSGSPFDMHNAASPQQVNLHGLTSSPAAGTPNSMNRRQSRMMPGARLMNAVDTMDAMGNKTMDSLRASGVAPDAHANAHDMVTRMKTMGRAYTMYQRRRQLIAAKEAAAKKAADDAEEDLSGSEKGDQSNRSTGSGSASGIGTPKTPKSARSNTDLEAIAAGALGMSSGKGSPSSAKSAGKGSVRFAGNRSTPGLKSSAESSLGGSPLGSPTDGSSAANAAEADMSGKSKADVLFAGLRVKTKADNKQLQVALGSPGSAVATPMSGQSKSARLSAKIRKTLSKFKASGTPGTAVIRGGPSATAAAKAIKPRYGSVTVGVDLPPDHFASRIAQDYFLAEIAAEIETRKERLRVAKVLPGLTVKVRIMDAPGDTPVEMLVKRLVDKIAASTLLIDAEFGELILLKHKIPTPLSPSNSPDKKAVKAQAHKMLGTRMNSAVPGEDEDEDAEHGEKPVSRVLLVSSRICNGEQLARAALTDVAVISFDWQYTRLDSLIYDIRAKMTGGLLLSVGIVSQWKPGAIGFVRRMRFSMKNLANAELRFFLSEVARGLLPGGCIDFFCVPPPDLDKRTDEVVKELGNITHVDINRTDALCAPAPDDGSLAWAAWATTLGDAATRMLNMYFDEQALLEWKQATPDAFVGKAVAGGGGNGFGVLAELGQPSLLTAAKQAVKAKDNKIEDAKRQASKSSSAYNRIHVPRLVVPVIQQTHPYRVKVQKLQGDDAEEVELSDDDIAEQIVPRLGLPKDDEYQWTPLKAPRQLGRDIDIDADKTKKGEDEDEDTLDAKEPIRHEHFSEGMALPLQHGFDMDTNLTKLAFESTGLGG